jgi:hypothetical protein
MRDDFATHKIKTRRSQVAGSLLTTAGFVLFFFGIGIALIKGTSMVAVMSLPVIIIGFVIRHNSKK